MAKFYASLIGPLLGLYYPLPQVFDDSPERQRLAMNSSRLAKLWHSVYSSDEVDRQIKEFGGLKLPDEFARRLDYDHHAVFAEKAPC